MPVLFSYLLKLSCGLALVYLFYQLVLRRLTFYAANRWYLLGYSALCFFLPFLNIAGLIEQHQLAGAKMVKAIPVLETYTRSAAPLAQERSSISVTLWDGAVALLLLGMVVLSVRLLLQYLSFRRMKKQAQLISQDGIRIYQVSNAIVPFSFGNSIFINQGLHSDAGLHEIIRHEYVHVKQRHTVDIIWAEVLCILNWYNPAAWGLRHAVRQNLEFIADSRVLQSGVDKREYQYLLLKVLGQPQFRIAAPFNFSSLKNRIVMMNKLKSAKAHLVKFLFMLPLLAVLLVAFRSAVKKPEVGQQYAKPDSTITITGLVVNADNSQPLGAVSIRDALSNSTATTDQRGYYAINIPVRSFPLKTELRFVKTGFDDQWYKASFTKEVSKGAVAIVGMIAPNAKTVTIAMVHSIAAKSNTTPDYEAVKAHYENLKKEWTTEKQLQLMWANSEKPYWTLNGRSFIVSKGGSWASWDEVVDVVYVDGKKMTGEDVNKTIRRSSFTSVSALSNKSAKQKYGVDQPVFEIFIRNRNPYMDTTLPPPPPVVPKPVATQLPEDYETFLKRNRDIRDVQWTERMMIIQLKSGKREIYDRNNAKSMAAAERKWGQLPVAPPPPPPPPSVTPPDAPEADTTDLSLQSRNPNTIQWGKLQRMKEQHQKAALQKRQQAEKAQLKEARLQFGEISLQRAQQKQVKLQEVHLQEQAKHLEEQAAFHKEKIQWEKQKKTQRN